MTYKNEDKSLVQVRIGCLAIGTSVVFNNDGTLEDIHIVTRPLDEETPLGDREIKTVVVANSTQDVKYPFFHSFDRLCYILKDNVEVTPNRHSILFDEGDIEDKAWNDKLTWDERNDNLED